MEKRYIIFVSLSVLIFIVTQIYIAKTTPPHLRGPRPPAKATPAATGTPGSTATPTTSTLARQKPPPEQEQSRRADAPKVQLTTRVFDIEFSTRGAVPERWDIIDPRFVAAASGESREDGDTTRPHEPLIDPALARLEDVPRLFEIILQETNARFYRELNTGLYKFERITSGKMVGYSFTAEPTESGLRVIKTYQFDPESFLNKIEITLRNEGQSNLRFDNNGTGLGIILGPGLGLPLTGAMARVASVDAVISDEDTLDYKGLAEPGNSEVFSIQDIAWGGIQNVYFLQTLIPAQGRTFAAARALIYDDIKMLPKDNAGNYPSLELYEKGIDQLKPGQMVKYSYQMYLGPKHRQELKAAEHGLTRVLFHDSWSWMRVLELGLLGMLTWLHGIFRNWGVAIILLTIIVRILTFPLVHKGMKAQAKMMAEQARLKPLMEKINEKYKNDPQRKQQEIFKLYKEHGVNPFGMFKGCLWMLIQMPILYALYKLFQQSIELRGAHFLWIKDLSQPDRLVVFGASLPLVGNEFNLLPILMAGTQVLTSKLSMQPSTDPQQQQMQKTMTYFMPIFMLFIFYSMSSGLVLYWFISNLWQILQQLWVNKHIMKPPASAAPAPATAKT